MLKNKNILIVGVANNHCIAAGIAKSMASFGANLAFTYQNERLKDNVVGLAKEWGSDICLPCDVAEDSQIEKTFSELALRWDGLDCIVHAVGFSPRDQLDGDFIDVTTREGFGIAHDISSFSFIALAKAGKDLMKGRNGSLLTLSYLGSQKTLPNYNVMGLATVSYTHLTLPTKRIV